jgi:hypothetical protein
VNQGIQYEISQVMPQAYAIGLFVSLCTIQRPSGNLDAAGYPDGAWVNVPGLVGIACMNAPPSQARVQATEIKQLADTLAVSPRHILLNGYFPAIVPNDRAVVDGTAFDILGAESDSQSGQTRLELRTATE